MRERHPTNEDHIPETKEQAEDFENRSRKNDTNDPGIASSADGHRRGTSSIDAPVLVENRLSVPNSRRPSRSPTTEARSATLANGTFIAGYEIRPGLAKPGIHYENVNGGVLRFTGEEVEQHITIQLNDERQIQTITEPIDFHVILLNAPTPEMFVSGSDGADYAKLNIALPGTPSVLRVQLLPHDAADYFEMQASRFYVDPNTSTIPITVLRQGVCHATSQVRIMTRDGTAKQRIDEKEARDYEPINEILVFKPGETCKTVVVEVDPNKQVS
ncbi:unnamed protein product [Echinostoma caproni]|uniref:Cadherin domain-containing protein n=1 Tax=Echinostoma caproni TaxID=27848 RepID=A0A183AVY7_9TREM|nr:unnamed protein product [Echinostoma caproni]